MVATFTTQYKGNAHTFQTIGLFNDGDPITFCTRYDWQKEVSLIEAGDTVVISETTYNVTGLDIDLTGVVAFSLEEM